MEQYAYLALGSILSILGTILVLLFKAMRDDIKIMSESVMKLNGQIATIITAQDWHKSEIDDIKKRLDNIDH